jgi:hypothetical protein
MPMAAAGRPPVNPIQIVPIYGAKLEAPAQAPRLTYRGGPLLTNVQVSTFFWGSAWAQPPLSDTAAEINAFFDYVLTSQLLDQLAEYSVPGMAIGHGARAGTATITDQDPPASVADADIQAFVQRQVAQPDPNGLYFVYLPPGVTVSLSGSASCSSFCGYHSDIGGKTFYAVMPYPDCSGCVAGLATLDALTSTSSHELCEAITDPIAGQGYYDDANGEIGDICAWQTKKLGAYTVQLEWSNAAGKCV